MKKIVMAGALCLFASPTYAEGMYGGVAYSNLDLELQSGGFSADSEPNGINFVLGNSFNKNFAIEGLLGIGTGDDEVENWGFAIELERVLGISAVGTLPLTENFRLYGKLGLAQVEYDDSDGDAADASGVMFGIGAALDVNEQFGLNLEYIQYPDGKYDEFDIDIEANALNFGAYLKF